MSNKNPSTIDKLNSITQNKLSKKNESNTIDKLNNAYIQQKEEEQLGKFKHDISTYWLNFRMRQHEKEMNEIWNTLPKGSKDRAKFAAASNSYNQIESITPPTQPQKVNFEEAKDIFNQYEELERNPIKWDDFRGSREKNIKLTFEPRPDSLGYVVFNNPENQGYVKPRTDIDEKKAKELYDNELKIKTQQYNKDIEEYNRNQEELELEKSFWLKKDNTIDVDDFINTGINTYIQEYNNIRKPDDKTYSTYALYTNTLISIDNYKNKHSSKWNTFSEIEHVRNITDTLLETLPKDSEDNILINGYTFSPYEAYKHIYSIVQNKFNAALVEDNAVNPNGLGRQATDYYFRQKYGYSFKDYLDKVAIQRLQEIRNEIDNLADEVVTTYTRPATNQVKAGFNSMNSLVSFLPDKTQNAMVEPIMETVYRQPFEDVLEDIDAIIATGGWNQLGKGLAAGFDTTNALTFGFNGLAIDRYKLDVLDKVNNGKPLSKKEGYIYRLLQLEDELKGIYSQLGLEKSVLASIGEGVGGTIADAPSFAIGMGLTSGIGSGVKYGTKYATKRLIKQKTFDSAKKLAWTATKDLVKWSGVNYARGAVAAPLMSFTYKSYAESALKQYSFDENGNVVYTPKDKFGMALGAFIDGTNELASEHFGAGFDDVIGLGAKAFGRATGISKWMTNSEIGTWVRRAAQSPMSAATKNTLRNLGYTGVLSEPLSEVFGDFMSQSMRMGIDYLGIETEYDFSKFKTADYWLTTMGVSIIYGGALTTVGAGRNIIKQANYAKKLTAERNQFLEEIDDEELRNTLTMLGNSDNFINTAVELADFNWDNVSAADKANAINYMRRSYVLQTTMGDMEGQRNMEAFGGVMSELYSREYTPNGKHTGRIYQAADSQANMYDVLDGNIEDRGSVIKVRNENGEITEIPNSELIHLGHTNIEDIMITEYDNRFSTESEMARLNTARQSFNRIANPSEKDIRRVTSEFGIRKPSVGKTVKLVDGAEATIEEDLQNGRYKIKKYNQETTEFEEVEIPVYDILSNNPISAAAQKKQYEEAKEASNTGNQEAVQEVYKSPEEKANDIINSDYDSRLFDDKGAVKLDDQQIINNFSLEDPASLEDYINKVGSKVSPQVRQSLNNALKLSKIHNEINSQLSHLVQTSKNRTDVAILSNILSGEIITSDPNITAEELLESIINNSNYNSKIRHDFKNILKALTNTKVQRRTTTKTKTSVTQKDVKGKRGRKQIEKGIKDLKEALKDNDPIGALNAINRIDNNLSKVEDEPITSREKQFIEETRKTLKEQGYEIQPMRGMNYYDGMKVIAQFELNPELPAGAQIIKKVIKPQINKDGVPVQAAEIIVEQGPEIEDETPDISQAVTKEMTENEPMNFSEPTDNMVESKKEDSIPQTPTEQEFTIPELEKAFAVPDSDKLIETSSREEEVETLTDDQRSQVRIHNENGTDLVDYISDSALPDDLSTDEVIVDKHELQGNRIYRYNGEQLRNNQAQVRRIPKKEEDNHDLVYKWLDENSIDLQGIIDNELAAIAALDTDVKFMMMTEGTKSGYSAGSPMLNTVFQVVEYTDAIKKIHNEKRGGIITSNGKEYLLIGITGFSTPKPGIFNPEIAHYNFIADKVLKSARNNYTSQTDEISRDAYYVHPTMSTKIKNIEAGWIVTQTIEDSEKQSRSLGELLANETRNPHGITVENSKWLIPTRNSVKPIKVRVDANDTVHGLKIPTGLSGGLFLLVPAANGHYIPVSVKIQTTNELVDGTLKDTIWEVAQNLLSTEKETRDYAIKELCKLLNLTKEGYNIFVDDSDIDFDNPNSTKIVFTQNGRKMATEIPLSSPNASAELYNTIFSNIPFQLNIGLQTLVSGELQAYIDAGALITDVALLGATNASYTVHSIGSDLKADPYTENSTESQEGSYENSDLRRTQDNGIINYGNNSYFRMAEDQYVNTRTGEPVTDVKTIREIKTHVWLEKSKPTPAKIEQGSKAKLYIVGENEVISVSKKGIITFYSTERSREIINEINRENIEESRINNAIEELARIEEQQQAEQVIPQELQEEKEASVPESIFTEDFDVFKDTESTPVEGSFEEVSFETGEEYTPKEKASETFTEGVVENVGADQLSTTEFLRDTKKQLIKEGIPKEKVTEIMNNVFNKLKEEGLESFYTSADESTIRSIVDIFKHCRNK